MKHTKHSRLSMQGSKERAFGAGDKKGQVAMWDHVKVYERTVYPMHRALTNNICFFDAASAMSCASASSDGLLKVHIRTQKVKSVMNMNMLVFCYRNVLQEN